MEQQQPIGVMIVDDHRMVRRGLRVFLSIYADIVVVGEAADGEEAIARCREQMPDVILMDMMMPNMDGPTAMARIRAAFPQVQIIALTSFVDEALVVRAIGAGALGYLLKDVQEEQLVAAIRDAYRGRATFDPAVVQVLAQRASAPPVPGHNLTKREREVLALLATGKTNNEIAAELRISPGTVHVHVSSILSKLGADNRTEAVRVAVQQKLIP